VKAAEDGKTYIYKGAYTVTVEKDGKSEKIKWTLE
jgi:hypothetical protein